MLFFVCHPNFGFIEYVFDSPRKSCSFTQNIRNAHTFSSYEDADNTARECNLRAWAVLGNCIG